MLKHCNGNLITMAIVMVYFTSLNNGVTSTQYNTEGVQAGVYGDSRIVKKAMSSGFERFDSNEENQQNGFQRVMESKKSVEDEDGEIVEEENNGVTSTQYNTEGVQVGVHGESGNTENGYSEETSTSIKRFVKKQDVRENRVNQSSINQKGKRNGKKRQSITNGNFSRVMAPRISCYPVYTRSQDTYCFGQNNCIVVIYYKRKMQCSVL